MTTQNKFQSDIRFFLLFEILHWTAVRFRDYQWAARNDYLPIYYMIFENSLVWLVDRIFSLSRLTRSVTAFGHSWRFICFSVIHFRKSMIRFLIQKMQLFKINSFLSEASIHFGWLDTFIVTIITKSIMFAWFQFR